MQPSMKMGSLRQNAGPGLVVLLTLFSVVHSMTLPLSASVKRKFLKSGFHRDLTTEIRLTGVPSTSPCYLLMKELIPSGAYVDLYQLSQLKRFGGSPVWTGDNIDIEKPEYLSHPIVLHIYPNISIRGVNSVTTTILLPVHLRYHRPSENLRKYVSVEFSHPKLYIHCPGDQVSGLQISAPCDDTNTAKCTWSEVTFTGAVDRVSVEVPVGEKVHTELVVTGTLSVTILACLWFTWSILTVTHSSQHHLKVS